MPTQNEYIDQLERLWDLISDAIEEGRITEVSAPDDYQPLVNQMLKCLAVSPPPLRGADGSSTDGEAPQYIIASGNPIDGLTFVGPFDHPSDAGDYASESNLSKDTWQVVALTAPEKG